MCHSIMYLGFMNLLQFNQTIYNFHKFKFFPLVLWLFLFQIFFVYFVFIFALYGQQLRLTLNLSWTNFTYTRGKTVLMGIKYVSFPSNQEWSAVRPFQLFCETGNRSNLLRNYRPGVVRLPSLTIW